MNFEENATVVVDEWGMHRQLGGVVSIVKTWHLDLTPEGVAFLERAIEPSVAKEHLAATDDAGRWIGHPEQLLNDSVNNATQRILEAWVNQIKQRLDQLTDEKNATQ